MGIGIYSPFTYLAVLGVPVTDARIRGETGVSSAIGRVLKGLGTGLGFRAEALQRVAIP